MAASKANLFYKQGGSHFHVSEWERQASLGMAGLMFNMFAVGGRPEQTMTVRTSLAIEFNALL